MKQRAFEKSLQWCSSLTWSKQTPEACWLRCDVVFLHWTLNFYSLTYLLTRLASQLRHQERLITFSINFLLFPCGRKQTV